jgi:hypothetical protein
MPPGLAIELAWLLLGAVVWLCIATAVYRAVLRRLPPQHYRSVPWGGGDVVAVLLLAILFVPVAVELLWQGVLRGPAQDPRLTLSSVVQRGVLGILGVLVVMVRLRSVRPYQMGLHLSHFWRYAALGAAALLVTLAPVAATQAACLYFFKPQRHVIEQLVRESPTADVVGLAVIAAVAIAPLEEELLFRGLLLPWLRRVLGPWPAIAGSSLLFASLHANAWPAPVPLFVLALFLGYLAHRTGSLVAPITLHAAFNALNMAALLLLVRHEG